MKSYAEIYTLHSAYTHTFWSQNRRLLHFYSVEDIIWRSPPYLFYPRWYSSVIPRRHPCNHRSSILHYLGNLSWWCILWWGLGSTFHGRSFSWFRAIRRGIRICRSRFSLSLKYSFWNFCSFSSDLSHGFISTHILSRFTGKILGIHFFSIFR